ncbi:hypothetical protein BJX65DRAFT_310181 [Aspergillus insuetus]
MASIRDATLLLDATMRQPKNVAAVNLLMPTIHSPADEIVRVVAAGICGTDLHTYWGHYGSQLPPWPMSHEQWAGFLRIGMLLVPYESEMPLFRTLFKKLKL